MRSVLRWKGLCLLGVLAMWSASIAQAQQPTVVLGLRNIDELLSDADFVGEVLGQEGTRETAEQTIEAFTGGKGLAGVDLKKPLGLYWNLKPDGEIEMPVVFIPVSDRAAFGDLIRALVPDLKETDGQWSLTVNGQKLFAKVANGYCFVSLSPATLEKTSDPSKIVNLKYDIAVEVNVAGIPQPLKEQFLQTTEQQGRLGLELGPEPENEAQRKGQELGFEWTLEGLKALVNDGDRITIGFDVNSKTRLATYDFGLTAKPNTGLASSMAAYAKLTPLFAAVAPSSAPLSLVWSIPTSGDIAKRLDEVFEAIRDTANEEIEKDEKLKSDADRQVAKRLLDIGQATTKSGSLHSVLVIENGGDDTVRLIAGTKIAKGDDAGKLLDDILKLTKENEDVAKVKVDVAKHAGARIHAISGDLDDEAKAQFGDGPGHLAVRADSLWFSMGGGNLDGLKKALDASGKSSAKPVAPISLRIKPATLVTLMEKDDESLIARGKELAGKSGDVLNVDVAPLKLGAGLHVEFGVDLFKLFAQE